MTRAELKLILEYVSSDVLKNPISRPLEVGFRHSPLRTDEILERYEDTCYHAKEMIDSILEEFDTIE